MSSKFKKQKMIKNSLIILGMFFCFNGISIASSWNYVYSLDLKDRVYFFDADSLVKNGDYRIVWFKAIQKRTQDTDGSWATAFRYKFNCIQKNVQGLGYSTYNLDGKHLKSSEEVTAFINPPPDSVADVMLRIVCKNNFPNYKSNDTDFFKIEDGDIYKATRRLVDFENSKIDQAPN